VTRDVSRAVKGGIAVGAVCAFGSLLLAACTTTRTSPAPDTASHWTPASPRSVDQLAAAVAQDAARNDHETDAKAREALAEDAIRNADACLAEDPRAAACLYYHGIALGLEARAHPLHAVDSLKAMVEALTGAEAADPQYDHAGPSRVRALVLTRAPGWPIGPGDVDAGLAAAQRAVTLQPGYPPNVLALAEAQAKTGDGQGARQSYARARDLARSLPPSTDRDDWLSQADKALQHN
jgi:hypothetical protein